MVKIDFTNWQCFASCPTWWQSFVDEVCNGLDWFSDRPRDNALKDALKLYNAKMVDSDDGGDMDYLIFDEESDFVAFRLKYGG
jgi:hypothetical protein